MMIYLLLFTLCIAVELSEKINTDNILKKIGIGFIAVGALIAYAGKINDLVEIGVLIYLSANICSAYCSTRKRRGCDL